MWGDRRAQRSAGGAAAGRGAVDTERPSLLARSRFRRQPRPDRPADARLLDPSVDLVGSAVTQLRFDSAVTLALDADVHLRIETSFEFRASDDDVTVLDPQVDLARSGPLLLLHRQRVAAFEADTTGALAITFTDGSALRCWPDDRFEAWDLSFADGRTYVCQPGGGVAIWAGGGD